MSPDIGYHTFLENGLNGTSYNTSALIGNDGALNDLYSKMGSSIGPLVPPTQKGLQMFGDEIPVEFYTIDFEKDVVIAAMPGESGQVSIERMSVNGSELEVYVAQSKIPSIPCCPTYPCSLVTVERTAISDVTSVQFIYGHHEFVEDLRTPGDIR